MEANHQTLDTLRSKASKAGAPLPREQPKAFDAEGASS